MHEDKCEEEEVETVPKTMAATVKSSQSPSVGGYRDHRIVSQLGVGFNASKYHEDQGEVRAKGCYCVDRLWGNPQFFVHGIDRGIRASSTYNYKLWGSYGNQDGSVWKRNLQGNCCGDVTIDYCGGFSSANIGKHKCYSRNAVVGNIGHYGGQLAITDDEV